MGVHAFVSESVVLARLRLISQLREACRRRADEPWLELFHYIVQLYRGYSDKADEGVKVTPQLDELRFMADSLGRSDPEAIWQSVDDLLREFPWQQDRYAELTDLEDWHHRFPQDHRPQRVRLVEIDPNVPGKLRPFRPDGRRVWLVIGGNRTHINGIEWQDPLILHEPLINHAETALCRFLTSMNRFLGPMLTDNFTMVGIVPSAIRSRWECRLENFAVTRFPNWSHPRNRLLAQDIVEEYGAGILQKATGTVLSAYSLGCAAAEQLMNAVADLAADTTAGHWSDAVYFAGYVGIRRDLGPRRRLQIVSLMDEAVFGSPDMPDRLADATASRWFSSPFTLQPNPWNDTPPGFDNVVAESDSGCGWSMTRVINDCTRLVLLAGQSSIPGDYSGNAQFDHDTRMAKTRFGHFLDATLSEFAATPTGRAALIESMNFTCENEPT